MRDGFIKHWERYFPGAELPVTFELRERGTEMPGTGRAPEAKGWRCIICDMAKIRKGRSIVFGQEAVSCGGGRYFTGFEKERFSGFRYFLSSGRPGVAAGERYKIDPETVDRLIEGESTIPAEGKDFVFKRWDMLGEEDEPEVVIFFAKGEVLSGLFTLANFDQADKCGGIVCPFGSGCDTMIRHPWMEQQKEDPKAVLGMFDPSARPCVPLDVLTFSVPMKKFVKMIGYMEQSFLITGAWEKVGKKIRKSTSQGP